MINTPEFKVGLLVVLLTTVIGGLTLKVQDGPGLFDSTKEYTFTLDDASGLIPKSAVKMAGIRVGIIESIELVDGKAHLKILVDGEKVKLTKSSEVEVRTDGILGDKHIELNQGAYTDAELPDGSEITNVASTGSLDKVVEQISGVANSLSSLAATLQKAVEGNGDNNSVIGRIVKNLETVTSDLADVTSGNKAKVNDIVDRVAAVTQTLDELINDESSNGFKSAWGDAVSSLNRIDSSLRNIEEATYKINNGQGTIGRLINEDETLDKVNLAIDNVNEFLGGAEKLETSFDFHSEYLSGPGLTKSYLGIKIQPGLDRFYEIAIVDDPRGVTSVTNTKITTGGSTTETDEVKTFKNEIKISALFAKNFYNFTVKAGLMESTGGAGLYYNMLGDRLNLAVEFFGFDDLNVKSYVKYEFYKGFYVVGGGDNLVNSDMVSSFVGAGIFITNDDLKLFASKVSF